MPRDALFKLKKINRPKMNILYFAHYFIIILKGRTKESDAEMLTQIPC